jgi:hypothetical protein
MNRIYIFTGKGGVGKSSVAAAHAVKSAEEGKKTILVSTDMAHNLGDIFEQKLGKETYSYKDNLDIYELDPEYVMENEFSEFMDYIKKMLQTGGDMDDLGMVPGMEELFGMTGGEEVILLTAENITGLGSDLQWVLEYLRGENITGTGSEGGAGLSGGTGEVYIVRKKDGGGYELRRGDRLIREFQGTGEVFSLTGEEELILLTNENITGLGSGLQWVEQYLQGANISGTGTGDAADYGNRPTRLEDLLNQTVPENAIYVQDNLGSGR